MSLTPLGIFWDIENCQIPSRKSGSGVAKAIREFIEVKHPECGYAKEFACACDTRTLGERNCESLNRGGVSVLHVSAISKNAADEKLKEHIIKYVEENSPPSVLVIITGDINFSPVIHTARRRNVTVMLIHGDKTSQDLKNCVTEGYRYSDVIKDVENVFADVNDGKEQFLNVWNLPPNEPIDKIRKRLEILSQNCGGKVMDIDNKRAKIRFGCNDDAQRALTRMKGQDVYGQKIKVEVLDNKMPALKEPNSIKPNQPNSIKPNQPNSIKPNQPNSIKPNQPNGIKPNQPNDIKPNEPKYVKPNELKNTRPNEPNKSLIETQKSVDNSDDKCKSVILGLETEHDMNVTKYVRKIVSGWGDNTINPNFIVSVERNTQMKGINGKAALFVIATNEESSKKLVMAANKYFNKAIEKIVWKKYRKREANNSEGSDTSNVSSKINKNMDMKSKKKDDDWESREIPKNMPQNQIQSSSNDKDLSESSLLQKLHNLKLSVELFTGFIKDPSLDPDQHDSLRQLYSSLVNRRDKYITQNRGNKKYYGIETEFQSLDTLLSNLFVIYEGLFGKQEIPSPKKVSNAKGGKENNKKSVIIGISTFRETDVLSLVRHIVREWKDPNIKPEFVVSVDRDNKWKARDGKALLFVTAVSGEKNKMLIKKAKTHFNCNKENGSIVWNRYFSQKEKKN